MATKNTALRNAIADATGALFNSGNIIIRDSANNVLVTFPLHSTAFNAASTGLLTAHTSSLTQQAATGDGTADHAVFESSDSSLQVTGLTVGTSAAQVLISDLAITTGQLITLTQANWNETAGVV